MTPSLGANSAALDTSLMAPTAFFHPPQSEGATIQIVSRDHHKGHTVLGNLIF